MVILSNILRKGKYSFILFLLFIVTTIQLFSIGEVVLLYVNDLMKLEIVFKEVDAVLVERTTDSSEKYNPIKILELLEKEKIKSASIEYQTLGKKEKSGDICEECIIITKVKKDILSFNFILGEGAFLTEKDFESPDFTVPIVVGGELSNSYKIGDILDEEDMPKDSKNRNYKIIGKIDETHFLPVDPMVSFEKNSIIIIPLDNSEVQNNPVVLASATSSIDVEQLLYENKESIGDVSIKNGKPTIELKLESIKAVIRREAILTLGYLGALILTLYTVIADRFKTDEKRNAIYYSLGDTYRGIQRKLFIELGLLIFFSIMGIFIYKMLVGNEEMVFLQSVYTINYGYIALITVGIWLGTLVILYGIVKHTILAKVLKKRDKG